jgi:hypothetical protein
LDAQQREQAIEARIEIGVIRFSTASSWSHE